MKYNKLFWLLLFFLGAFPVQAAKRDIEALQADVAQLDGRLQRLETRSDNQALVELFETIEQLKREVQSLRDDMERLSHDIEGVSQRQRNMYLDIDRRLNDLQIGTVRAPDQPQSNTTPANSSDATAVGNGSVDEKQEREDYSAAFNYLKEGRYPQAIEAFKTFLGRYPNGRYAENAQYWLGEANYAAKNFEQALLEFEKVLQKYPGSTKVPGAKLKMGYTYYELQRWKEARQILNDVLRDYPSSSVAPLAEKRLIRMTKEGY